MPGGAAPPGSSAAYRRRTLGVVDLGLEVVARSDHREVDLDASADSEADLVVRMTDQIPAPPVPPRAGGRSVVARRAAVDRIAPMICALPQAWSTRRLATMSGH